MPTAIRLVSPGSGGRTDSPATTTEQGRVDEQRRQPEEPVRDHASGSETVKRPPLSRGSAAISPPALCDEAAGEREPEACATRVRRRRPTPGTPGSKMRVAFLRR